MQDLTEVKGLGETTAERLHEAGYDTIESIAKIHPYTLAKVIGRPRSVAKHLKDSAKELIAAVSEEKEDDVANEEIKITEEVNIPEEVKVSEKISIPEEELVGKSPLYKAILPTLIQQLEETGYEKLVDEVAREVAGLIAESGKFKDKLLNAALKDKKVRERIVEQTAEGLV